MKNYQKKNKIKLRFIFLTNFKPKFFLKKKNLHIFSKNFILFILFFKYLKNKINNITIKNKNSIIFLKKKNTKINFLTAPNRHKISQQFISFSRFYFL